jgi:polyphosphate kinase
MYSKNDSKKRQKNDKYFDVAPTRALRSASVGITPSLKSPTVNIDSSHTLFILLKFQPGRNEEVMPKQKHNAAKETDASPDSKLKRKDYEQELLRLQGELCRLQEWVKSSGQRIILVFEGRDGAGKGGTIKAITERVSPRVFHVVALPAPSDREKTQLFMQRYMAHFPAAGEIVIFDRSWYNRAGVEHVMGFCSKEQHRRFLELCPLIEKYLVSAGIKLIKYWLEVSNEEQARRFEARIEDPVRQWKLSPMDLPSRTRWYDYSRARDAMLEATDTEEAPWYIIRSDDKKRARLNCISHFLSLVPYKKSQREKIKLPKRSNKGAYDDHAAIAKRRFIPEKY